jgi:hypothetical protein
MQHPGIFGWIEETTSIRLGSPPEGWREGQWVLQKNPQYAQIISRIVRECPPDRVILLTRNPFAICRSLLEPLFSGTVAGDTVEKACEHLLAYYAPLLRQQAETPDLFVRARYENIIADPRGTLTVLLREAFDLPFDERCLSWKKKSIRLGFGDPKTSETTGWNSGREETWRQELSKQQKDYIRLTCRSIFESFSYEADDD